MFIVDDVLADMLGEDLVQHVVDRQAEALFVLQQLLHQEGVKVVGVHHVVPATHHHQIRLSSCRDHFVFSPQLYSAIESRELTMRGGLCKNCYNSSQVIRINDLM